MTYALTKEMVLATSNALPSFPRVIEEILATLDNPDTNLHELVSQIERDPVITAKILSQANVAAIARQQAANVDDVFTAASIIGLTRLRQTAVMSRLSLFLSQMLISPPLKAYWEHSVAVGVCAEQLSYSSKQNVGSAMVAGLLHDIGQLWLLRFESAAYQPVWNAVMESEQDICNAEREVFGVDHGVVGAWLAEIWSLPKHLKSAIKWHHAPDKALLEPLVPVVHIAEVLSHALDLTTGKAQPVRYLSQKCCESLDITWGPNCYSLFGRIEACARHAMKFFQPPADSRRARQY